MNTIYLDNNATTYVDENVILKVIQVLKNYPGNPSSTYSQGRVAKGLLLKSREIIANFLKVKPKEIIFTSGGTEGANMIIKGFMQLQKGHVITSSLEHSAVYNTVQSLEVQGIEATYLKVGDYGAATVEDVEKAIRPDTKLIALMAVNNETGVKTDIHKIAALAESKKIAFFVDGVSWFGKELFEIPSGVSAITFSGHKFHAPKGVGFAFIKSNLKILPLLTGGEQEYNRRGGTENLAGIAAMAEAVINLEKALPQASKMMQDLRDYFETSLSEKIDIEINGTGPRICNTSNLSFSGVDGETLLAALDIEGVAASHGSACASGAMEPSRILIQMGYPLERVHSSIRFSLSRYTTKEEIDKCVDILIKLVNQLRSKKN